MSWTRISALLPGALFACARVSQVDGADAGPQPPQISAVEPAPGKVAAAARYTVRFSSAIDEAQLLASSGRSETVVLAADAVVDRAAAAIAHPMTVEERQLVVPAAAQVAADLSAITVTPDQPLPPGRFWLLVSPRLKDLDGRRLPGTGARFAFDVQAPPPRPRLVLPAPGSEAASNLAAVHAFAAAGQLALLGPDGAVVAGPVPAQGAVELALCADRGSCKALQPGARYTLSLDGVADEEQVFTASACAHTSAPALQGGAAQLEPHDTSVAVHVALDWPARLRAELDGGLAAETLVACSPSACAAQEFSCTATLALSGLLPATDYTLRLTATDDQGFTLQAPDQPFSTLAPLPRMLLTEVMASPPGPQPRSDGEYVELLNLGPGSADLSRLALEEADGTLHPLLATAPALPLLLPPGRRALAVGSSFDASRYPWLPVGTPVLRAATTRLLGRGLTDASPPALRLAFGAALPVELASFPGGQGCPDGQPLQRDESVPPEGQAAWRCGVSGGTPGAPP